MKKIYAILGICCALPLILVLLIISGILSFEKRSKEVLPIGVTVGKFAQDFSFKTIEGETIKLSDFRGKYVLFAFMSPSCGTCLFEAGNVQKAQEEKELVVIQININPWSSNEDLIKVRDNFGSKDWLLALDNNLEIANLYNVKSFDTTLVLDPQGKIIYRDDGWPIQTETIRDLLE